jgi:23S rRNA (uracil1939-C5)-methyltransferase/tRNA (uracil-5-)-methyltransferase
MDKPFNKITPACPVFGRCGGCQHQDISYDDELRIKEKVLLEQLLAQGVAVDGCLSPAVPSPKPYHYRSRIDLKLLKWRDGSVHVGFSSQDKGPVVEIDACPIALEAISEFIPQLKREAAQVLPPKYRIANLIVRAGDGGDVRWGGIGRRSTRLSDSEYLYTDLGGKRVFFSLDTFFQANLSILPELRRILRGLPIWRKDAVFFDLYGGVGLFSLMLHDLVSKAIDIEENVHAVRLARWNMMQNHVGNMEVLEGRVEDILPDILAASAVPDNIVMVDPPRAGLSESTVRLLNSIGRVGHLMYLSCQPESLARDLKGLTGGGWRLSSIRPFDFFPRTRHLETLVTMSR